LDPYLYFFFLKKKTKKSGALLALGLVTAGVRNEVDPAFALLSDFVNDPKLVIKNSAIMGLGLAYAGSMREDVLEILLPIVGNTGLGMELSSLTALALGHVFVASCHPEITSTILETLMERDPKVLKDPFARFLGLGLALLYLGIKFDSFFLFFSFSVIF